MTDDWKLKEYYLTNNTSYTPDCNHEMRTKESIDNHNKTADDMVECSWCQGTGFWTIPHYDVSKDIGVPTKITYIRDESKRCEFCKGTKLQKRDRKYYHNDDIYYSREDIEILRKKLIQDIIDYTSYLSTKGEDGTLECPKEEIIEIIKKRFGIK